MRSPRPPLKLAALGVLALALAAPTAFADEAESALVPSLLGKTQAEAIALLEARGLQAEIIRVAEESFAADTVIGQDPRSGAEVLVGARIELRIVSETLEPLPEPAPTPLPELPPESPGPAVQTTVPALIGLQLSEAEALLRSTGLIPQIDFAPRAGVPAYSVFAQSLAAGSIIDVGSEVRFAVAAGEPGGAGEPPAAPLPPAPTPPAPMPPAPMPPAELRVPNVVGLSVPVARQRLANRGLASRVQQQYAPDAPIDKVFEQDFLAGTLVAAGTEVTIRVPKEATVPNLMGVRRSVARTRLQNAGLAYAFQGPTLPDNRTRVTAQSKPAGSRIAEGSRITVTYEEILVLVPLAVGVRVPDVVGMSLTEARTTLEALGFVVEFQRVAGVSVAPRVLSQSRPAEQMAAHGSTIRLRHKRRLVLPPGVLGD